MCHQCSASTNAKYQGEFSDQEGLVRCSPCPYRLSSQSGSTKCTFCAENFYSSKGVKELDLLRNPNEFCLDCPDDATCGRNTTIESINVNKDYWRHSDKTSTLYQCQYDNLCNPSDSSCRDGHKGALCEVCIEIKKYFNRNTGNCDTCPSFLRVLWIPLAIIIVGTICLVFNIAGVRYPAFAQQWDRVTTIISCISVQAKIKILISFFQVFTTLDPIYGVQAHADFTEWFKIFNVFNLSLAKLVFVPGECFGPMWVRLLISALWPYVTVPIIIFGVSFIHMCRKRSIRAVATLFENVTSLFIYIFTVVFYLALPSVSSNIFDAIKCQSFQNDDENLKQSYLIADIEQECDGSFDVIFWILFLMWPILMPFVFFI